jgi:5-methyltetrahydropteroyltriglutamate--homocysteine methyltransferase
MFFAVVVLSYFPRKMSAEKVQSASLTVSLHHVSVSIEDAHRYNDLELFTKFKKTTIIVGVVKIASSQIETVDEIHQRVSDILDHIPKERLILAPDCGLAYLPDRELRIAKLKAMVEVAQSF